jgi:hypothetical protein
MFAIRNRQSPVGQDPRLSRAESRGVLPCIAGLTNEPGVRAARQTELSPWRSAFLVDSRRFDTRAFQ